MQPRVLITDAQERAMVAALRDLRAGGYRITAAADVGPAAGHWSRACGRALRVPSPVEAPTLFIQALAREVALDRYDALLPGGDASLMAISQYRGQLEPHVPIKLPPHDVIEGCVDKLRLLEEAERAGVPCPRTIKCSGVDEALSAAEALSYPVLLKPNRTVFRADDGMHQLPAAFVSDEHVLAERVPDFGDPCLVQECISGPVWSCSGMFAGGKLLAFATSRYSRTYPPVGGPVAHCSTIDAPPRLRSSVEGLVRAFGWEGIFELELMQRRDGTFAAIDFNPRVFGSMSVVIRAGAPLPRIWCAWVRGENPGPATANARANVHYRWEDADARHFLWQLRRGRLFAAAAVLRPRRGMVHAYFRWRDPGPLFARLLYMAGKLFRKRGTSSSGDSSTLQGSRTLAGGR